MNDVVVMMSTYFGEKYIKEQLDSLLNQDNIDLTVCIRDDGSSDNTCNIIKKYQAIDNRIQFYEGENLGVKKSFLELIRNSPQGSFYAFCDQDDVWDRDKLYIGIESLKGIKGPAIYSCKKRVVTENLEALYESGCYDKKTGLCSLARKSDITGCTMVFNSDLMNLLKQYYPETVIMHDGWVKDVCLCASGTIVFDSSPHISYRQHGNNVIGGKVDTFSRIKRISKNIKIQKGEYKHQWEELKRGYYNIMNLNEREILDKCIAYQDSLSAKIKVIADSRISGFSDLRRFLYFCYRVLTEKY